MLRDLEKLIDECDANGEDGERLEISLRQAAQNLWRSQFLYQADFGSKTSFDAILQRRSYFENLFEALGYRIVGGRPNDGFLGLISIDLPPRQTMRLDESLLLLVLRLYYEEAFKRYEINDAGEIEVEGEAILQVYEERTRRLRPAITRLHEILTSFRQRGLIRIEDAADTRNFRLFLRPALPLVVTEEAIGSLEEFLSKARIASAQASDNSDEASR